VDTAMATEERTKLRRSVGRYDTAFLMLAAIIVLDTLGAVSSYGAQAFTWLVVMVVFFLFPYGLLTAELGTAFPEEGGPYVWVREAFGRVAAAVVAVMYWVDNPIWLAGTLSVTAMAAFSTFFVNLSLAWEYVFGLLFIWAGIASVIMALKFGKGVANIGAIIRVVLIAFFTLTVFIYAGEHGVHGFGGGAFKPTWLVFLAAAPILIFDLEGFELPSAASEELINPRRDVPFAILRSGIGTVLFYGVPILAILLVLPPSRLSNVTGFLDALQQVFVVYGGHLTSSGAVLTGAGTVLADIAAIGVILGLLSSGVVWLIGSDRAQAVAGFDGAAPRPLGRFSKRLGTPIVVNLLSGVREFDPGEGSAVVDRVGDAGQRGQVTVIPQTQLDIGSDVRTGVYLYLLGADHGSATLGLDVAHGRLGGWIPVSHAVAVRYLEEPVPGADRP
jgi:amino acid transporter